MRGFVFYDGPSLIDGAPIVGIAVLHSENSKTGDMIQTYILRSDMAPMHAIASGEDASICGTCTHRGGEGRVRTCYVDVGKSVTSIFMAWTRGAYPLISPARAARLLKGRRVRIGSYGDPAAIRARYWRALISQADGRTGYTHQWRESYAQALQDLVMASAESAADRDIARSMGWRTFRVRTESQSLGQREIVCPASPEGGHRRQCIDCLACDGSDGTRKASVAIIVHGKMARHFQPA